MKKLKIFLFALLLAFIVPANAQTFSTQNMVKQNPADGQLYLFSTTVATTTADTSSKIDVSKYDKDSIYVQIVLTGGSTHTTKIDGKAQISGDGVNWYDTKTLLTADSTNTTPFKTYISFVPNNYKGRYIRLIFAGKTTNASTVVSGYIYAWKND